jgi:hypothetical protein
MGKLGRTIVYIIGGGLLIAIAGAWMAGRTKPEWDIIQPSRRAAALKVISCIERETYKYMGREYHLMKGLHFHILTDPRAENGFTVALPTIIKDDPVFSSNIPRIQACHPSWRWLWIPPIGGNFIKDAYRHQ